MRLIHRDSDAQAMAGQIMTITWSIHTFTVCRIVFGWLLLWLTPGKVESMLAIEFALEVIYSSVSCRPGLTCNQDTYSLVKRSAGRIEGMVDDVRQDIWVCDL